MDDFGHRTHWPAPEKKIRGKPGKWVEIGPGRQRLIPEKRVDRGRRPEVKNTRKKQGAVP